MPDHSAYRMPAEWEPHDATWLSWPHEITDWPGKFACIPFVYAEIVRRLARSEKVGILVNDDATGKRARRVLAKYGVERSCVEFHNYPTDRSWIRDYGPIFVRDGEGRIAVTNWIFNAWAKYDNWAEDNSVPPFLARRLELDCFDPGIVLEGGSIDVFFFEVTVTTE